MRTVSKSLITLSMCLGLSGAVYAQATPTAVKPSPTAETAKAKPAGSSVTKNKSAAVSGESATPAVKSPKREHAARVTPKPAVEKSAKPESPDAKKLDSTKAKEPKSDVSKPESVKKQPGHAATSSNKQPEHAAATSNGHKPMKHQPTNAADQSVAAKPAK
jgi:hypothetical protein